MYTKTIKIGDFLTDKQIKIAQKYYTKARNDELNFAKSFAKDVISPNIKEINEKLGQENDPTYLAYAVEYALSQF